MAVKTKKAAKRKTKKRPMFRAETAGERRKNFHAWLEKTSNEVRAERIRLGDSVKPKIVAAEKKVPVPTYTLTMNGPLSKERKTESAASVAEESSILIYARRGEPITKKWRVDLRGGDPVGKCVEVIAVDAFSGALVAVFGELTAAGFRRRGYALHSLEFKGYGPQGMEFDKYGRVIALD